MQCETHGSSMFYRLKHCNSLQSMLSVFIPKRVVSSSGMGSAAGHGRAPKRSFGRGQGSERCGSMPNAVARSADDLKC